MVIVTSRIGKVTVALAICSTRSRKDEAISSASQPTTRCHSTLHHLRPPPYLHLILRGHRHRFDAVTNTKFHSITSTYEYFHHKVIDTPLQYKPNRNDIQVIVIAEPYILNFIDKRDTPQ